MKLTSIAGGIAGIVLTLCAVGAQAQEKGMDNPRRGQYVQAVKGKRVVFVPLAMGFDLTEAWAAVFKKQAARLGYTFEIRDPNWSADAGARAIQDVITEGADVLISHNPDIQSYGRLLQQAESAGIKVIQLNMETTTRTDAYVGADWVEIGELGAKALVAHCAPGKSVSNKVAIIQGIPTGAADVYQMRGVWNVLEKHPEIQVVSQQAGSYDPAKARSIMATIIQQHPDLCGVFGIWDSQDAGAGSALQEAGKADQVFSVTSGGGNKTACENLRKGLFDYMISYDAPLLGEIAAAKVAELLETKDAAGARKTTYFTPLTIITKENANDHNCWTLDDLK
jgi:ribose transport system substrate-binding protein